MAILNCECGHTRNVPDKYIGKRVKCPQCQNGVSIGKNEKRENPDNSIVQKKKQRATVSCSNTSDIPTKIKELINKNEQILYASNPSRNALIISMIVNGIIYGIVGLSLYMVGIIIVLPIALFATYYSWKNKYYVITDSRTIVAQGIFNVAIKIINNRNIQIVSINTGIIDRWLKLNSIELSTAGQGGGSAGLFSFFPGMSKGSVTLKQVITKEVIKHYY